MDSAIDTTPDSRPRALRVLRMAAVTQLAVASGGIWAMQATWS